MGVDVWVGVADRARTTETLQQSGVDEIWDLLSPFPNSYDTPRSFAYLPIKFGPESMPAPQFDLVQEGALCWPTLADPWFARGVFRGLGATGSYKPHFYLRNLVEHLNLRADAPKDVIEPLDVWLSHLLPYDRDDKLTAMIPCSAKGVYGFPPAEVAELAELSRRSRNRIEDLRPAITAQLEEETWIPDFDSVVTLLQDWAEILTRAQQRGWGLLYLID